MKKQKKSSDIKYFLWVRWSPEYKEAFEITEGSAEMIEKHISNIVEDDYVYLATPTGYAIRVRLKESLAFKIVTKQINPLEADEYYDNPIS